MGRLFDSAEDTRQAEDAKRSRNDVRRRAEEADIALAELGELDEASKKLGDKLSQAQSVQPIKYKSFRKKGSRWQIEHAQVGEDYVYQLFQLKPSKMHWKDIVTLFISAMDVIFPRSIDIKYAPPSNQYGVKFYTIRVEKVVGSPGWEAARDRALNGLVAVNAWT